MLCLSELTIIFQSYPDSYADKVMLIVRPDEINKLIYKDEFICTAVLKGLNLEESCTNISVYSSSFEKVSDVRTNDKLLSNPILIFIDGRRALYEGIIAPYNAYVKPKFTEIIRELNEISSDITIMNTEMSFNVGKNRIELTIKSNPNSNQYLTKNNIVDMFKVVIKYCKPYSSFDIVIRDVWWHGEFKVIVRKRRV